MNITINGDIYITNYGQTLDEIVGNNEEYDLPSDFLTDDEEDSYCNVCNDDCEDCGLYDSDDRYNDDEIDIDELVDALTDVYAEELSDSCLCPECVKDLLVEFIRDFIDLL